MSALFNPADYVRITNKDATSVERGKKQIRGRFDSVDYVFPYNEAVDVPIAAAMHIFGFGRDDKSQALARLGWAATSLQLEDAMERMSRIKFEDMPQLMEVPRLKKSGDSGRPLGQVGGANGEEESSPDASAEAM